MTARFSVPPGIRSLISAVLLLWPLASGRAQVVTATVPVGTNPVAVAVNPVTNKIYVANCIVTPQNELPVHGTVTVIDGTTNATTTITVWSCPTAMAVNPVTNMIYVADFGKISFNCQQCNDPGNVTVIDGATNSTVGVLDPSASNPDAVAVDSATNQIYVANEHSANVTVIDGATNSTTTVPTGVASPYNLAVNTVTNKIYVTSFDPLGLDPEAPVMVIDGATNSTTTATDPNAVNPVSVSVDPVTNKIYVANVGDGNVTTDGSVTVIDGNSNSTTNIFDPEAFGPNGIVINTASDKIYVSNFNTITPSGDGGVTVIDGATNSFVHVTDPNANAGLCTPWPPLGSDLAVDPVTGNVYRVNQCSNNITVIYGATNSPTTITDPNATHPAAVAVNPTTDKIYVVNNGSNNVTVIDGGAGAAEVTLSVSLSGAGSGGGTVTSSPIGINCPGTCSATFSNGTAISLTASSASPSTFSAWSGACAGATTCTVTMNANEDVTAYFGSSAISVSLSPALASIKENATQAFTATVTGDSKNLGVTWNMGAACNSGPILPFCGGSLGPSSPTAATYFAPNGSVGVAITITATSVADITKSASETLTIAPGPPPDFSLSVSPTSVTIQAGFLQQGEWIIVPGNNFAPATVQFACSVTGPAPMPTCFFNDNANTESVTIDRGSGSQGGVLWISVPASAMAVSGTHRSFPALPPFGALMYATWFTLMFVISTVGPSGRQRCRRLIGPVLLALLMLTACGGNSTSGNITPPPKNYAVTVTATSGAIQHTAQMVVTVQ